MRKKQNSNLVIVIIVCIFLLFIVAICMLFARPSQTIVVPPVSFDNPSVTSIPQSGVVPVSQPVVTHNTETVLVMDVSGSMEGLDDSGVMKISAAKTAARNLLEVIQSEQTAFSEAVNHEVGLVSFSDYSQVEYHLTEDINAVKSVTQNLQPYGFTALGAGLMDGLNLFDPASGAMQMVILMSDGLPNVPIDDYNDNQADIRAEIMNLASQAGSQGICVNTVGFGSNTSDPEAEGFFDEQLLRDIAAASTCGAYYNARNAGELANIFLRLRHSSLGEVILEESGEISQGEERLVGNVELPRDQAQMLFTLNWPGSQLEAKLVDPRGQVVTPQYPSVTVTQGDTVASVVIIDPIPGVWTVHIVGTEVPGGWTTYNAIMSIRQGVPTLAQPTRDWTWPALIALAVVALGTALYFLINRPQPYLAFTSGSMQGKRIPLQKQTMLGRSNRCQVVIPDETVGRQHAQIYLTRAGWMVQDLNSRNSTLLNDQKVQRSYLRSGDVVTLGETSFIFMTR